jgi:predicted ester cyclase
MSEENKALVRRLFEDEDRLEGNAPAELFAPGFTAHIAGSPPMDLDSFEQFLKMWYNVFSDWSHNVEDLVAEGDRVAVRVTAQATHTGEFMGVPASGKRISVVSTGIARIAGGKIAEWWNSPDQLGLMQQLGLIPPPQDSR